VERKYPRVLRHGLDLQPHDNKRLLGFLTSEVSEPLDFGNSESVPLGEPRAH